MSEDNFKTWFSGFSRAVNGAPTKEQWEVLVAEISLIGNQSAIARLQEQAIKSPPSHPYNPYTQQFYQPPSGFPWTYDPHEWRVWC